MKKELKILLVEDNEGDVRIIKELMKEQTLITFGITFAVSLAEAKDILSKRNFDIILLDLGLPDSTGLETFIRLKELYPKLNAIIILTGLNDTEIGLNAVNQGAQDYIIKGQIDSDKLIKTIVYSYERNCLKTELEVQLDALRIAENELVLSREKLNLIAIRTGAAMYQTGLKGLRFEYVHQAIENLTGYNETDLNNIGFLSIIKKIEKVGGEAIEMVSLPALWEEKMKKEYSMDYLIETRNGELKWLNDKSYPWINEAGKVQGSIGILMDICSLKEVEIDLVSQKNKSEQLFLNSPVANAQLDVDGNILNVNACFEHIFGHQKTEIIGENLDNLIVSEEFKVEARNFYLDIINGIANNQVSIRKRKDGSIIYVSIAGIPIKTDKKVSGFYMMYVDMTKQKLAEEALIIARNKAEESDRLKTAFLHNISHEIRTPMNAIVGFSSLLMESDQSLETTRSFIETIVQNSNHLLAIMSDIVEISNIEAGNVKILKNVVDLNIAIKTVYDIFNLKIREINKSLNIKTTVPNVPVNILTDSTKLYQVLSNLVNNAIKFTESGQIDLGYSKRNGFIEFFVSDTGIGIPEEQQGRIFERFYQVDYSKSRFYEGTGLGLSISKAWVELLGGKIWLTSEPGKGSTFYFTIPFADTFAKEKPSDQPEQKEDIKIAFGKKILIAEDIESNYALICFFLSEFNAETQRAANGKEAVDYYKSHPDIDLILMDIKMPVMDGYAAAKIIREINPSIPIIAQTAYADDRTKALESGCNGFISKPFDRNQLLSVINEYL